MKIYKDPLFSGGKTLMGFKGTTTMDSGYFYAPYVPLTSTPTVLDPNSFSPTKGIMSRYGKKIMEDLKPEPIPVVPEPSKPTYRDIDEPFEPSFS